MTRDSWFKCDPQDFSDGIEDCESGPQALVYVQACFRMYASGGPIANNPRVLGALAHCPSHWAARHVARLVDLGKLEELPDGRLYNHRVRLELEDRARVSQSRSRAGREGGRPKKAAVGDLLEKPSGRKVAKQKTAENREAAKANAFPDANGTHNPSNPAGLRLASVSSLSGDGMADVWRASGEGLETSNLAENVDSEKANAFHARAREEREDKNTPSPPKSVVPVVLPSRMPDFGNGKIDPDERERLVRATDIADHGPPLEVDVAALLRRVMTEARMTAPPTDLVLVESWIRYGASEDLVVDTVRRMASQAKTPPRQMRYFDAEIRRLVDATGAEDAELIAKYQRIAREQRAKRNGGQ